LLLASSAVIAQQSHHPPGDNFETRSESSEKLDKKSGSIFRRPAKDNPAQQLEYARELEENGHLRRAAKQYDALVHRWHFSEEAPVAQFAYARVLYERKRYERAFKEFQYLMQYFSGLFDFSAVLDDQLRIANAPNWEKAPEIRLMIGMIYENAKEHEKAVTAYESVFQHHPGTEAAQTAALRQALCLADLSDKSPRDERRCRGALSALASFQAAYPRSEKREETSTRMDTLKPRLEEMYYERACYYDKIEKRPKAAIISYREFIKQFPGSDRSSAIVRRIEELERQQDASQEDKHDR